MIHPFGGHRFGSLLLFVDSCNRLSYSYFNIFSVNLRESGSVISACPNLHIIQIQNDVCAEHGFTDANPFVKDSKGRVISGCEKALYYLSSVNTSYDKVWILEDDAFIYNESTLLTIDSTYPASDCLSPEYEENLPKNGGWHWV